MTDASLQPYWLPDVQDWAIEQERMRHLDALYAYGEYAMFILLWRIQDFNAGLVGRCPTCYLSEGKIADTYGQGKKANCPDCFGTTFEGGYRAKIIRPSLWDHDSVEQHVGVRGDTYASDARIQVTPDFATNTDDFAFRADGTRWQLRKSDWDLLRTGFQPPFPGKDIIGWNFTSGSLQDQSSVAYIIPPTDADELCEILHTPTGTRYPPDFSAYEDIRGYLGMPEECAPKPRVPVLHQRVAFDTASGLGAVVTERSFFRASTEATSVVDVAAVRQQVLRAGAEVAPGLDAVVTHQQVLRAGTETAPGLDAVVTHKLAIRTATESIPISDVGGEVVIPGTPQLKWVAAAFPVITSVDDNTWTAPSLPVGGASCVAYNGSLWVVGGAGIFTSPDGVTWTQRTSVFDGTGSCLGVGWNGSMWLAVGYNTSGSAALAATSPDGITWTTRAAPFDAIGQGNCVAWNGSLWVVGGSGGPGGGGGQVIVTTPDGITWTHRTTPMDGGRIYGVAYNGSTFLACGKDFNSDRTVMTSPNGITWTAQFTPMDRADINHPGGTAYAVAWSPGRAGGLSPQWVVVGFHPSPSNASQNDMGLMTSLDGTGWTGFGLAGFSSALIQNGALRSVAWNGTEFMVGDDGSNIWFDVTLIHKVITNQNPQANAWTAHPVPANGVYGIASNPETIYP